MSNDLNENLFIKTWIQIISATNADSFHKTDHWFILETKQQTS